MAEWPDIRVIHPSWSWAITPHRLLSVSTRFFEIIAEALAQVTAAGLAGLFAGASAFMSVAQHPALLQTACVEFQAPFFRRMYFYAARMQAPLALGSGAGAFAVAFLQLQAPAGGGMPRLWIASGCLITGVVPFTMIKMLSLNRELLDPRRCRLRGSEWMQAKLRRWGRLHALRAGASVVAFAGMLVAMACADRGPAVVRIEGPAPLRLL